jgi:ABC-type uncharacterized transport system ATPase subunit
MPHAEEICQSVIMMHKGKKVLDERIDTIRRQYDPRRIHFDPLDPNADLSSLRQLPEVEHLNRLDGSHEILLREGTDTAHAIKRIVQTVTPARVEVSRPQLEDVFIKIVSSGNETESLAELRAGLKGNIKAATA